MTPRIRALLCLVAMTAGSTGFFARPGAPAAQIIVCNYGYDCRGDPHWRPYTPEDRALADQLDAQREEQRRQTAAAEQRRLEVQRDSQRAAAQSDLQQRLREQARQLRAAQRARENEARYGVCPRDRTSSCVSPQ